jgi:hypothetical protein
MKNLEEKLSKVKFKISTRFFQRNPEKGLLVEYARKLGGYIGSDTKDGKGMLDQGRAFRNILDFFLYATFLGIRLNKNLPIKEDEATDNPFQTLEESRQKNKIIPFLYMILLTKSEKSLLEIEQMSEDELDSFTKELVKMAEGYANAGFQIIMDKREENQQYFENTDNFVNFIVESQ